MKSFDDGFEKAIAAAGAPLPEVKTILLDNPELAARWIRELLRAKIPFSAEPERGDELIVKIKISYGKLGQISARAGGYFRRGWYSSSMSTFDDQFAKALAAARAERATRAEGAAAIEHAIAGRRGPEGWSALSVGAHFKFSNDPDPENVLQKIEDRRYKVVAGDPLHVGLTGDVDNEAAREARILPVPPPAPSAPAAPAPPSLALPPGQHAALRHDRSTGRSWLMFPGKPPPETIAALKREGWRWSGFRREWHHPSKFARPLVPFVDEGLVDYSEERAERLQERARKKAGEAAARIGRAESIASQIPLGQPILVGHHSERRHRRDIERIQVGYRKGFEAQAASQSLAAQAAASAALHEQKVSDPEMIARRLKKSRAELARFAGMTGAEAQRRAEIVRAEIARDEKLLSAGPLPEKPADVARRLKAILKTDHPKIRVRAGAGRAGYIEAYLPMEGDFRTGDVCEVDMFSAALRNAALDAVYGKGFARNQNDPSAGNVRRNSIALRREQWKAALASIGVTL